MSSLSVSASGPALPSFLPEKNRKGLPSAPSPTVSASAPVPAAAAAAAVQTQGSSFLNNVKGFMGLGGARRRATRRKGSRRGRKSSRRRGRKGSRRGGRR